MMRSMIFSTLSKTENKEDLSGSAPGVSRCRILRNRILKQCVRVRLGCWCQYLARRFSPPSDARLIICHRSSIVAASPVLMPIVASMRVGNAGTQALTVAVRGLGGTDLTKAKPLGGRPALKAYQP